MEPKKKKKKKRERNYPAVHIEGSIKEIKVEAERFSFITRSPAAKAQPSINNESISPLGCQNVL